MPHNVGAFTSASGAAVPAAQVGCTLYATVDASLVVAGVPRPRLANATLLHFARYPALVWYCFWSPASVCNDACNFVSMFVC